MPAKVGPAQHHPAQKSPGGLREAGAKHSAMTICKLTRDDIQREPRQSDGLSGIVSLACTFEMPARACPPCYPKANPAAGVRGGAWRREGLSFRLSRDMTI